MNQNEQNNDYNIVIDTLQKKLEALEEMQRGSDNSRRVVGGGIGMLDSFRYEQIDELTKAIEREKAFAHVNKMPKNEHDSGDVLKKSGNVDMMREALQACIDYGSSAWEDWLYEKVQQALAAEPDHIPDATKMVELERKVRAQAQLIGAMEGTTAGLRSQLACYNEAIKTLGSEREANRILTKELEVLVEPAPNIADEHRTLAKWLNEEIEAPIDRVSLAKVLAATQCLAVKECVTTEPAQREPGGTMTPDRAAYFMRRFKAEEKLLGPNEQAAIDLVIAMLTDPKQPAQKLVRLTKGEINCIAYQTIDTGRVKAEQVNNFAKAIMDAMIAKNGGKHD